MHMNLAARALERVGDNAVDIGEQVGFLRHGRVPRVHRRLPSRGRRRRRCSADGDRAILVVEDEESLADSVRYNLEREGYAVSVATDGRRALERFRDRPAVARDLGPDAARGVGPRRVPDDPDRVRRPDHHGHREGLGGRQGHRARARAPTTTSPSRSRCASSSRACGPTCAGPADAVAVPPWTRSSKAARSRWTWRATRWRSADELGLAPAEGVRAARGLPAAQGPAAHARFPDRGGLGPRLLRRHQDARRAREAPPPKIEDDPHQPEHLLTVRGLGYKFVD